MKLLCTYLFRVVEHVGCFRKFFFFLGIGAGFVLCILLTLIWVQKDRFLLRTRGIREQVHEIPDWCSPSQSSYRCQAHLLS